MKKIFRIMLVITLVLSLSLSVTVVTFATDLADNTDIKVQYNGEYIEFTDAYPEIINGRTMVPFRQILETMGADVYYDGETNTVMASYDQVEFSFVIGERDIVIMEDGETRTYKMDVTPFLDSEVNRIYVPVRFMAECMGYHVGWDNLERTAIVIDSATLFDNADEDFSIISKLMSTDIDMTKAYETTGIFNMDFSTNAPMLEDISFSVDGDMQGVQQKSNADLTINFNIETDLSSLTEEEEQEINMILSLFEDINMTTKLNGETGLMYMNSDIFSIIDPSYDSETWFEMDIYSMYEEMGLDIKPLMSLSDSSINLSEMLDIILASMSELNVSTYQDIKTGYAVLKKTVGDDCFEEQIKDGITIYTLELDKQLGIDISADISIEEKDECLHAYDVSASGSKDGISFMLNILGDQMNAEISMTIEQDEVMDMDIYMTSELVETDKEPSLTPPEGAKIIDYNTLIPTF